jgi:rSAM/selenodomain-associated transferase 1
LGHERACWLYRLFVDVLLQRCRQIQAERQLWYSPPERVAEFVKLAGGEWALRSQGDGDLGRRLQRFFEDASRCGAGRAVAMGADSPNVPLDYVRRAFDELNRVPIVLGKSDDGGYYLVGIAGEVPPIFDGISWGTAQVWEETVSRLRSLGLAFAELPTWYDVDQWADVQRLVADLVEETDPLLAAFRAAVLDVLGSDSCAATTT